MPISITGLLAAGGKAAVRVYLTSGVGTLLSESQAYAAGATASIPVQSSIEAQSVYTLTKGVSYVFGFPSMSLIAGTQAVVNGTDSPFYMFAEKGILKNQIMKMDKAIPHLASVKVDALENAMLKEQQVDCPVIHRFGPGTYIREVHIPAGALAVEGITSEF